jgi:predicted nucleic acid-binding protein
VEVKRLCLDTSAYSHFKRGHAEAVELISTASEVLVPVVVLGELRAGFRFGGQSAKNEAELKTFLRQRVVRVLEVDDEASSIYAELMVELRRAGTGLPSNDVWIGALAAREGALVLTYDAHFAVMRRVAARTLSAEAPRR